MAYLQFINGKALYECKVNPQDHLVELNFAKAVAPNNKGFDLYLKEDKKVDIGGDSYHGFNTVYRTFSDDKKRFILSDDGSVWTPKTTFIASNGGTIEGQTEFEVYNYEDLVIPTPVDTDKYKFVKWNPEIPTEGEIKDDHVTFTAEFERHDAVVVGDQSYDVTSFSGLSFVINKTVEECETIFADVESFTVDDVEYEHLVFVDAVAEDDTHTRVSFYQKSDIELRLDAAESDIEANRDGLMETYETTTENTDDISDLRSGLEEVYELIEQ